MDRFIKGIVFLLLISFVFSGCKAKKSTVSRSSGNHRPTVVSSNKKANTYKGDDKNDLPPDTGVFEVFNIASPEEYIETFASLAKNEMALYGIPASITLAQGLLESGLGRGELTRKTNNHFGIKCHTGWEGDYDFYDDDAKGECFRKYNHPRYSYRDHSIFLATRGRYAFLFDLPLNSYKRWAHGLRKAGYATDRHYPQKLIELIERYKLYKYDGGVVVDRWQAPDEESEPQWATEHVVQKGDTLYSLSRRYNVSVDAIKSLNRLSDNTISVGQKLTIRTNGTH